jgi:CheY-like chemotaxis protein
MALQAWPPDKLIKLSLRKLAIAHPLRGQLSSRSLLSYLEFVAVSAGSRAAALADELQSHWCQRNNVRKRGSERSRCPMGGGEVSKLIIVDDDHASEILAENLRYLGHEVTRLRSADEAMAALDKICASDLLILDIIMPSSQSLPGADVNGSRTVGMVVFQNVRKAKPNLPILAITATNDPDIIDILKRSPHTTFLPKWSMPSISGLIRKIEGVLGIEQTKRFPKSFIVHGHDEAAKLELKNYLQNTLGLPEPIILHEQPSMGRTIIEKFEDYSADAQLAFVLLTPDDKIASSDASNDVKRQARQNVILELGFFLAKLGRLSGRVFLLHKGPIELPSDLNGVIYVDIADGVKAAGETIRKELKHVLQS